MLDRRQQQVDGQRATFAQRLADRRQPDDLRQVDVVEADHGQVLRHPRADLSAALQHPDGPVGRTRRRSRSAARAGAAAPRRSAAPRRGHAGRSARGRVELAPRTPQLSAKSEPAILAGREAVRVSGMVSDKADAAMAPREQMRGSELPALDVVDDDAGKSRVSDVDAAPRAGSSRSSASTSWSRTGSEIDQQPGDAVAARQVAHRVGALLRRLDVEEQQVVARAARAAQPLDHAAHALDHRRRGEERHDDADRRRPPDREVARRGVEPVAQLVDGGLHALARRLHHERAVVEHARHRRDAHAGVTGNITDRRTPAPR